jgi:predicted nucleic acid-binding protein
VVVEEEGSDAAAALVQEKLVAPSLMMAECANALWAKSRRGELSAPEVIERIHFLLSAPVDLVPLEPLVESAAELALELGHPIYDCLYLALARQLNGLLVTADGRFATVVQASERHAGWICRLTDSPGVGRG